MMMHLRASRSMLALALAALLASAAPVFAAEYFVNKQGSDANNGRTRVEAFLTIQKGVDALQAGDTLTIGPGEYAETVERTDIGNMQVDTIIRAEVAGTAILRGDIPAPEFKKVDGYRFIYAAPLEKAPQAVLEHNGMHTMLSKANIPELEFNPGFFHFDEASKTIYISNIDLSAPEKNRYTLAVVDNKAGFTLYSPKRVIIDGLAVTGYYPNWGILLGEPNSCTVRNCIGFMNVGGICLQPTKGLGNGDGGSNNVVEHCVAYGNSFGGIVRYGANNDIIRNCRTYDNVTEGNEHFGVMHYSTMTGPLTFKDNIAWGQNFEYSVKSGNQQEWVENCVGLGHIRIATPKMSHNLFGDGNEYDRNSQAPADTILLTRENNLDRDIEFADPLNMDYRLQADSRFRGTAPDKSDRGPYPYKPNIFYVSPNGNDQADGLSMRKPWKTLARAFANRRPGDTLYLAEGEYAAAPLSNAGDGTEHVRIAARGRGTVLVNGRVILAGDSAVAFERINFSDSVNVTDGQAVAFKNCSFFGPNGGLNVVNSSGTEIRHSVFAGAQLRVTGSQGTLLTGNLYAQPNGAAVSVDSADAIRYSDYNNYMNADNCWEVAGAVWPADKLRPRFDQYSQNLPVEFKVENGAPKLADNPALVSIGPANTSVGIHHEYVADAGTLGIVGPFVHSVTDTTANIEWWGTHPATYSLKWGETPQMTNTVNGFAGLGRFNTFSLTGLKRGTQYYFQIVQATPPKDLPLAELRPENAGVTFQTAARAEAPRTLYVAAEIGNDQNSGLAPNQALRTISGAADKVRPGDTVLIAGGNYPETVRMRVAGTPQAPITFKGVEGAQAALQAEDLPRSFELIMKPDYRFDALYFRGEQMWRQGFVIQKSPRVQITRCLNAMVAADESPEMVIRNCVVHGGWTSAALGRSDNSVVENNVFIWTILRQVSSHSNIVLRNNIFGECLRGKQHQQLLDIGPQVKESNNCFHLRWPEIEKIAVHDGSKEYTLPEYRLHKGSDSVAANPMMPGNPGWMQGWVRNPGDDANFEQFFTTNPELVLRGIGLQPEQFANFNLGDWPYTKAWATEFMRAATGAAANMRNGNNTEALSRFKKMLQDFTMSVRLKAEIQEQASICAERAKNYTEAMELAKAITIQPLSWLRQMQVMVAQNQYDEILKNFSSQDFARGPVYPELEDVMADLYYLRSQAHVKAGNLDAAEADLKVMNDKRQQLTYRSGEIIHDLNWLRLGDFYRTQRKDDNKALEAYLNVCNRTTVTYWGTPPKPVLTGADPTLAAATKAACEILRKQGKPQEAAKLEADLAKAKEAAAAALRKN